MAYKYQSDYDKLSEVCPPKHFTKQEINPAFRWFFNENDHRNFVPQYHRNPKRFIDISEKLKCIAMGLSFFKDLQGAKERYKQLSEISPNIGKTIGTYTSKGFILEDDGVNGNFGHYGHFTHHAFETDVFNDRFKIV